MRDFRVVRGCILVVAVFLCSGLIFGADWANWRGPKRDGISAEKDWNPKALNDGAKILWKASIGTGFSSIAIADGKAYTMGNIKDMDYVFCFNAITGDELWKHSYEHPLDAKYYKGGTHSTPTVVDGKVYTISKRGHIFCLDAKSGDVVWEKQLKIKRPTWGLAGSPVVVDDLVIYNAAEFGVAVKKATGKVVWQNGEGPSGYSTPVPYKAGDVKAAILFGEKSVFAVEVATGTKLWDAPWKTRHNVNAADPILSGDKVFITSGYGSGCALIKIDGDKASRVWGKEKKTTNMRSQMSGPVLLDGYVYGINQSQLVCLEFKTGKPMWSFDGSGNGSVIIAGGKLVVLSAKGKLYIAEATPKGFKEISSAQILKGLCWSPVAFSDGKVYARTAQGDLVCVDLSNE
ncbi:MAG: PQQ-binding-like beta-propeller repeat protein [Planctomycetes bacterium]|nr:PQQ-binding-like beta-propeller repeat protein [Planctomycetota bacterium]